MTSIVDVASRAGVSTATVSRVLNGKTVRADLAEAVLRAAEELQYSPNRAARSLRRRHSEVVADVYAGLVGLTPVGFGGATRGFWPMVAGAAALAVIGPTAWEVAQRLQPARWAAAALALLLTTIFLKVGDDANLDFIYAQF